MAFIIMKLTFQSDVPDPNKPATLPAFTEMAQFMTSGVVMNVFLLDPTARLLAAFIWIERTNTIGLFALLDWDQASKRYVFVDTGIPCVRSLHPVSILSF